MVGHNQHLFICAGAKIYDYVGWSRLSHLPQDSYNVNDENTSLALDEKGKYLAAGTINGHIWVKDLTRKDRVSIVHLRHHESAINDIKFCTVLDNKLQLATASSDKTIKLSELNLSDWIIKTDNIISISDNGNWVRALCYSIDGKYMYSGGEDQQVVVRPTTMKYIYNMLSK
jgi:WD40 repeat protein